MFGSSNTNTTILILRLSLQAIRTGRLDICGLPALCQELLDNWSKVVAYLSKYAPQQEKQGVRNEVKDNFRVANST